MLASNENQLNARTTWTAGPAVDAVEDGRQSRRHGRHAVAPVAHRAPAHPFDEFVHLVAGLVADHVAQQPAEQADVVAGR